MKRCSKCKDDKPAEEFRTNKAKKDGLQSLCIPCDKAYAKEYYQRNKTECVDRSRRNTKIFNGKFQSFKDGLSCTKCSEDDNICLDFHHLYSETKEHQVSQLVAKGNWERLMEEVDKCIVLCANCHRKLHRNASLAELDMH